MVQGFHAQLKYCIGMIGGYGIFPDGVSRRGVRNEADEKQMTAVAEVLYERLRSAPPFRYAIIGVEVDNFRDFSELDSDMVNLDFSGLVISDAVWKHLGSPSIFIPFEIGYRWRPFVKAK